jgi:FixJ family two-component response regulator
VCTQTTVPKQDRVHIVPTKQCCVAARQPACAVLPPSMTRGYSNKGIGRMLGISDGTVKNHLSDILRKLEARDRTHAVLKAIGARML